jgi:hypothetical protein
MTRPFFTALVAGGLCAGLGCTSSEPLSPLTVERPASPNARASSSVNKEVTLVDFQLPSFTTCPGGETLDLHIVGRVQTIDVSQVPQTIVPASFRFIYSNAAGETYVWHQVAMQRFTLDRDGNLIMQVVGRLGYDGNTGRLVINLTTGEVISVTGREVFAESLACAALT